MQSFEQNDDSNTVYDCVICTEKVTDLITCKYCSKSCCYNCFERYIIDSGLTHKCMHCSIKLLFEDIIEMSNKEWYKNTFRPIRRKLLVSEQKKLFDDKTTRQAKIYYEAKQLSRQPEVIKTVDPNICSKSNGCVMPFWCEGGCACRGFPEDEYIYSLEHLEDDVLMANRCVEDSGRGWENFNWDTLEFDGETNMSDDLYKLNMFPCPISKCIGYVLNAVCNICNKPFCNLCREEKKNEHKCDADTVKSILEIKTYCRSCPKCYVKIYKIDGCDRMFCTECKTTFSWATSRIIINQVIQPIYTTLFIRGLRKDVYNCNDYISVDNLISCFSLNAKQNYKKCKDKISLDEVFKPLKSEEQYLAVFLRLHDNILKVRATAGNHANVSPFYAQELRVQLLTKEIDKKEFIKLIEERDFDYNKSIMHYNIYNFVYTSATILFDNLDLFHKTKKQKEREAYKIHNKSWLEFLFETHVQLQEVLKYANDRIDYMKSIFGNDDKFCKFHR